MCCIATMFYKFILYYISLKPYDFIHFYLSVVRRLQFSWKLQMIKHWAPNSLLFVIYF